MLDGEGGMLDSGERMLEDGEDVGGWWWRDGEWWR